MISFIIAITSAAFLGPLQSHVIQKSPLRTLPDAAPGQPEAPPVTNIDMRIDLAMDQWEPARDPIPYWNWYQPVDQKVANFDFLLSTNNDVRLASLFGLGVNTIVIDPGHGGRDPGAIGANGTMEKDITLDIALRLKKRLAALDFHNVLLTREKDRTVSLADRVEFAKIHSADIFISIHINSLPNETVNLIETYYFGAPLNIQSLRLAEKENKDSHFSVTEMESIVQDFGNTLKRQESAILAADIQNSLFRNMKFEDRQIYDSGVKMAPFVVLSQTEIPSILVEVSCITKADEEAKLALKSYREKVASYLQEGIVSYLATEHLRASKGEN